MKKNNLLVMLSSFFLFFVLTAIGFEGVALADDYVPPVTNATYKKECGACHWAYLPGLLPSDSWGALMDNLDKHFGEDASLETADLKEINNYLNTHSADSVFFETSRKISRSGSGGRIFTRIIEVPYIQREHDEISKTVFKRSGVRSFSNCTACHTSADKGNFDEDFVKIPGR